MCTVTITNVPVGVICRTKRFVTATPFFLASRLLVPPPWTCSVSAMKRILLAWRSSLAGIKQDVASTFDLRVPRRRFFFVAK